MQVKVIDSAPVRVAYLRHVGPYGPAVQRFWQEQFYPFLARHGLLGRPIYGVSHDDPNIAPADKLRYDTGVVVDDSFQAPAGSHIATIAGGRYASLRFKGDSVAIGAAWTAMLREWLPSSGYQLAGTPCFEYYPPDAQYDEASGSFECDIRVPLAPL